MANKRFRAIPPALLLLGLISLLLTGCASAPDRQGIQPSFALEPATQSVLGKAVEKQFANPDHPAEKSAAHLLSEGTSALSNRLMLIDKAEQSLDLQYYLFHHDTTGILTTWSLLQAADRGVRIRLLVDDLEPRLDDYPLKTLNAHPNIEVRIYNPFYSRGGRWIQLLADFDRLNHRMHNKALIADNLLAIVGGRNIGDEYFDANQWLNFGDLDVMLMGSAVAEISSSFDDYWNSAVVYPLGLLSPQPANGDAQKALQMALKKSLDQLSSNTYLDALEATAPLKAMQQQQLKLFWAPIQVWADNPLQTPPLQSNVNTSTDEVLQRLLTLFKGANKELFLVSPYFVPLDKGTQLLAHKSQQGVKVTVITNALESTDVVATHAGYSNYRRALLNSGIKIYEVKSLTAEKPKSWSLSSTSSLHAKVFIVDNRWVFIGSFNLDPRSARLNTELGVLIDSPPLAEQLKKGIQDRLHLAAYQVEVVDKKLRWTDLEDGSLYASDPNASLWRRLLSTLISLLPVEEQL